VAGGAGGPCPAPLQLRNVPYAPAWRSLVAFCPYIESAGASALDVCRLRRRCWVHRMHSFERCYEGSRSRWCVVARPGPVLGSPPPCRRSCRSRALRAQMDTRITHVGLGRHLITRRRTP